MKSKEPWRGFAFSAVLTFLSLSIACTSDTATAPLIGAWRSSIEVHTGAFAEITDLEFMYVFNAGGTLTESSNYDGAPPVPPAYGVWRMIGPNEFEARVRVFLDRAVGGQYVLEGGRLATVGSWRLH